MEKDIFQGSGVPERFVKFFQKYQEGKDAWFAELNGRFAMNFRHYILEGMGKKIEADDLLVAAAIFFSHHELYLEYLLDPKLTNAQGRGYELQKAQKTMDQLALYMARHYMNKLGDSHDQLISVEIAMPFGMRIKLPLRVTISNTSVVARYMTFFRELPDIWGLDFETKAA